VTPITICAGTSRRASAVASTRFPTAGDRRETVAEEAGGTAAAVTSDADKLCAKLKIVWMGGRLEWRATNHGCRQGRPGVTVRNGVELRVPSENLNYKVKILVGEFSQLHRRGQHGSCSRPVDRRVAAWCPTFPPRFRPTSPRLRRQSASSRSRI
jgi:hypothetical protein